MLSGGTSLGTLLATPYGVKILIGINLFFYVLELFFPWIPHHYSLSPVHIANESDEFWPSLFFCNFVHVPLNSQYRAMGILHISISMFTLWVLGGNIEEKMGTLPFMGISSLFVLLLGSIMYPLTFLLAALFGESVDYTHSHAFGFSGILIGLLVVEMKVFPSETTTLFGQEVPKWLLPLSSLIAISIMINTSLPLHLGGLSVGILYVSGIPGCFQLRHAIIKKLESAEFMEWLIVRDDFHAAPSEPCIDRLHIPCTPSKIRPSENVSYSAANNDEDMVLLGK